MQPQRQVLESTSEILAFSQPLGSSLLVFSTMVSVVSFLPDCFLSFNEIYPPGPKGKSSFGFLRVRCLVTGVTWMCFSSAQRDGCSWRRQSRVWDRKAAALLSVHVGKAGSGTPAPARKEAELLHLSYLQFMV